MILAINDIAEAVKNPTSSAGPGPRHSLARLDKPKRLSRKSRGGAAYHDGAEP
jgi:hypothetical protein